MEKLVISQNYTLWGYTPEMFWGINFGTQWPQQLHTISLISAESVFREKRCGKLALNWGTPLLDSLLGDRHSHLEFLSDNKSMVVTSLGGRIRRGMLMLEILPTSKRGPDELWAESAEKVLREVLSGTRLGVPEDVPKNCRQCSRKSLCP